MFIDPGLQPFDPGHESYVYSSFGRVPEGAKVACAAPSWAELSGVKKNSVGAQSEQDIVPNAENFDVQSQTENARTERARNARESCGVTQLMACGSVMVAANMAAGGKPVKVFPPLYWVSPEGKNEKIAQKEEIQEDFNDNTYPGLQPFDPGHESYVYSSFGRVPEGAKVACAAPSWAELSGVKKNSVGAQSEQDIVPNAENFDVQRLESTMYRSLGFNRNSQVAANKHSHWQLTTQHSGGKPVKVFPPLYYWVSPEGKNEKIAQKEEIQEDFNDNTCECTP
ncbi:hypothetical protein C8R47DRAFT_1084079 [Mycena vitilis]|nr:hypothetical protein C8R47DRAFT_1084910 [Mycena vitilis]KAJ6451507.1 hypothetical protein C8R47DRAFT_1084079 [Mycena vitilis]